MANLVYQNEEAEILFLPASQAETVIFEIDALGSGAGHQSAQHDFGVAARARRFTWRAFLQLQTGLVVNEVVRIYIKTESTAGHPDNDDGTGDLAVSAEDKLKNLHMIGLIRVDEAVADREMVASGEIEISATKINVVFWNATSAALTTDETESGFILTPVPDEIQ